MFKILFVCLLAYVPVVAQAEWSPIAGSNERTFYIDKNNVIDKGSTLEFWVKSVIHTDLTKDGQSVGDYSMAKWSVNCDSEEMGVRSYANYGGSKLIFSDHTPYPNYKAIIPESIAQTISVAVCLKSK